MPRYREIQQDTWVIAKLVILRYPETKKEYDRLVEIAQTNTAEQVKNGAKPVHKDPTAQAAMKLYDDARFQRIKREVTAVDHALEGLDGAANSVIRKRFWSRKGKVLGYRYIHVGYSERAMHKVVKDFIRQVAYDLGEM